MADLQAWLPSQDITFVIKNTSSIGRSIKVFNTPIGAGNTLDLMKIPGVTEEDIRSELTKTYFKNLFAGGSLTIVTSTINFTTYDSTHAAFLVSIGLPNFLASTAPNFVQNVNTAEVGPAATITFAAPAITAKGSGNFLITATACPVPTGEPDIQTLTLYRDSTQLQFMGTVVKRVSLPAGPGDNTVGALTFIDTVTDNNSHVYSMSIAANTGTIFDYPGHMQISVYEI